MYGDSELDIPAQKLYTELDAQEAVNKADFVVSLCKRLVI